jgi:L-asparaginase II
VTSSAIVHDDHLQPAHVANHHDSDKDGLYIPSSYATSSAAMSDALAEYLSALDARDAREKAHEVYINACMYSPV